MGINRQTGGWTNGGPMSVEDRKQAVRQVKKVRKFYEHLFTYIVINLFLLILNLLTSPDRLWFYWVTLGWGIGLIFHGFSTFFRGNVLGKEWEEKKIRKYMEKGQRRT